MALMTPMAQSLNAFDATKEQTVTFVVTGGDQVVKNRITVRSNVTNEIVYQNTVESYQLINTIPSGTLQNGRYYNYYINTYNVNDEISPNSNVIQFYCLTNPTLTFTNIPSDNIINGAGYTFNVLYSQQQQELLNELYMYLYDANDNIIQTSDLITTSYTPPVTLQYTFDGFEDSKYYSIQARGTTINGTAIESEKIRFLVHYNYDTAFFRILLENNCNDGYIDVESHLVGIDGENHGGYFGNSEITLTEDAYAEWKQGFSFLNDHFVLQEWWNPVLRGNINIMQSTDGALRIETEYKRGLPPYSTEPKDYIEVRGYYNNVPYFLRRSNYIDIQNNNSLLMSYVKIDGNNFDIRLAKIDTSGSDLGWNLDSDVFWGYPTRIEWNSDNLTEPHNNNFMEWNGESNVVYNRITDIYFNDNLADEIAITGTEFNRPLGESIFITDIKIMNSVVDHWYITKNVNEEYSTHIPQWTQGTVMSASMDGTLEAGNIGYSASNITSIKVKRRLINTLDWVTIYQRQIQSPSDLNFAIQDAFVPSGKEFEYAIVPCVQEREQSYFISNVTSKFNGVFVSELDRENMAVTTIKMYSGVNYEQDNITQDIGILKPFNQVFPIITQNAKTRFRTLTVSGEILDKYYSFDANEINDIREQWTDFLTDGKVKFIKDWNGNVLMGKITTPPSYTYRSNTGMIVPRISFVLTEQGKYDNVDDLKRNGYLD